MKLAIRMGNHGFEVDFKHLRYIPVFIETNVIEERTAPADQVLTPPPSVEEILAKHATNLDPEFFERDMVFENKPYLNSGEAIVYCNCLELAEKGHDPACRLYQYPVPTMDPGQLKGESVPKPPIKEYNYTLCPCLENFDYACEECATAIGGYSGGCSVTGCVAGRILATDDCYCIRPGFVKCFECTVDTPHSTQCSNCDGSTRIPKK